MPFYTVHCNFGSYKKREGFAEKLAHLHAQTFGTDWRAVRVEFLVSPTEGVIRRFVSLGFACALKVKAKLMLTTIGRPQF